MMPPSGSSLGGPRGPPPSGFSTAPVSPRAVPSQSSLKQDVLKALADAPDVGAQRNILGNRLYPLVKAAVLGQGGVVGQEGKITGMLLEMDPGEVIYLLEENSQLLAKVKEAIAVLRSDGRGTW